MGIFLDMAVIKRDVVGDLHEQESTYEKEADNVFFIIKPYSTQICFPSLLVCRVWQLHTGEFNRVFKKDNKEQKQKKLLAAHRRSRRKVPYSADWLR